MQERPSSSVFNRIRGWLTGQGISYLMLHHAATHTSEDSATARGEALEIGAKALVMKLDGRFALFVLSAARQLDSKKIRAGLGIKKTRFATVTELMELTGLVPGAVPPFGRPFFDLDLYVDTSITQLDRIAFNAGSLTDSIVMAADDYLPIADATLFDFAKETGQS